MGDMHYLKYLIAKKGLKVEDVAKAMGITKQCLYRKINGKHEWYLKDLKVVRDFLGMTDSDLKKVFDL